MLLLLVESINRDLLSFSSQQSFFVAVDDRGHRGESRRTFFEFKSSCYIAVEGGPASKASSCQRFKRLPATTAIVAAVAATTASGQPLHYKHGRFETIACEI